MLDETVNGCAVCNKKESSEETVWSILDCKSHHKIDRSGNISQSKEKTNSDLFGDHFAGC